MIVKEAIPTLDAYKCDPMAIEKSINEILTSIENGEYTIPEFQRGYVWNPQQVKSFFRSLYLGYPSGSFLIWKTQDPSKLRGDKVDSNSVFHHLILDGQQRLTTIYTIFKGQTPSWYEGVTLRTDLHFNLETQEFEYYMVTKMKGNKEWINVSDFLRSGGLNAFLVGLKDMDEESRNYYHSKIEVLNDLDRIRHYGYYIKEITMPEIEKVVEIFNLVNKTGTTLSESDLALAIVTSNWPAVKNKYREAVAEFGAHGWHFDFNFFTRCLNMVTTDRGKYTSAIGDVTAEQFEEAWVKVKKAISHVINVLRSTAYMDSSDNLSTVYVMYVLVYFLYKNNNQFSSKEEANKAVYWMFVAQLWGRFSGSSESFLEKDLNVIKATNSVDDLIKQMHIFRGANLYLTPDDLSLQGVRSKVYNVFYCAVRAQDAKDWTNPSLPLYSKSAGYNNQLQRHHIFPKAYLRKKYDSGNTYHRSMINEISNMAYITQQSNMEILDGAPSDYLPKIDANELRKQFVPLDETLYTLENFERFLEERRRLLCDGINRFLKSYYEDSATDEIPRDLEPLNQKIESIEVALRDLLAAELDNAAEEDSYREFVPQHLKDKIDGRIKAWLKKNPGEDEGQFSTFRSRLNYFDLQEYNDLMQSKEVWPLLQERFGVKPLLQQRIAQLAELRNCIRHSRNLTEVALKEGEAAIAWFNSILRPILKEEQVN